MMPEQARTSEVRLSAAGKVVERSSERQGASTALRFGVGKDAEAEVSF
jgi:hypothetical protein